MLTKHTILRFAVILRGYLISPSYSGCARIAMRHQRLGLPIGVLALLLAMFSFNDVQAGFCGDGICDTEHEDQLTCCTDCGCPYQMVCNGAICELGSCGDNFCDPEQEDQLTCCTDCGCPAGLFCSDNSFSCVAFSNDPFSGAIDLDSAVIVNTTGNNDDYTGEIGEPAQSGDITSAWWRWTAPSNGTLTINTSGSAFDTVLTVATGNSVASLVVVAQNDDEPGGGAYSEVTFNVTSGVTYFCAVDGYQDQTGDIVLNLNFDYSVDPSIIFVDGFESRDFNDLFSGAIDLDSAVIVNTTGNNDGYTGEVGEPAQSGDITSAWWRWAAPSNGTLTINTSGSAFDTVLTVATGNSVANLVVVAQNDDEPGGGVYSEVTFNVTSGVTYFCAVDGYQDQTGDIVLNLSFDS